MMKKYIAPKTITINGEPSSCECDDTITCAYCVQANLMLMERKLNGDSGSTKAAIKAIRKNGVRRSARQLGEHENTLRRWIKSGNIPHDVVEKVARLYT